MWGSLLRVMEGTSQQHMNWPAQKSSLNITGSYWFKYKESKLGVPGLVQQLKNVIKTQAFPLFLLFLPQVWHLMVARWLLLQCQAPCPHITVPGQKLRCRGAWCQTGPRWKSIGFTHGFIRGMNAGSLPLGLEVWQDLFRTNALPWVIIFNIHWALTMFQAKHVYVNILVNLHNNSMRKIILLLSSFYRWGNWSLEQSFKLWVLTQEQTIQWAMTSIYKNLHRIESIQ